MKKNKADVKESFAELRRILKNYSAVYVKCNRVSPSGMSRNLSFFVPSSFKSSLTGRTEKTIRNITWQVAHVTDYPLRDACGSRGMYVKGCGMDMGFHVVSTLASILGRKLHHEWL